MAYRPISCEEAVIGMTVVLTTHRHGDGPNNPVIDGKHACLGVIDDLRRGSIYVSWANGYSNVYESNDLSIENDGEGSYVDIWRDLC